MPPHTPKPSNAALYERAPRRAPRGRLRIQQVLAVPVLATRLVTLFPLNTDSAQPPGRDLLLRRGRRNAAGAYRLAVWDGQLTWRRHTWDFGPTHCPT
jgi:hypothetical protein